MHRSRHRLRGAWPVRMRLVLPEGHVQDPVQASRDVPVCPRRCQQVSSLGGMAGDEVAGFDTAPASHSSFRLHQQEAAMNNGLPCHHRPQSGSGASRSTSIPTLQSSFQRLGSSRAHPTGDVVLRSMARQTQECLQPSLKQPGFGVDGGVPGLAPDCKSGLSIGVTGFGDLNSYSAPGRRTDSARWAEVQ